MKKLDYGEAKLQEVIKTLVELQVEFVCLDDSIDIQIPDNITYKKVQFELRKIRGKKPPLGEQFNHTDSILSLFSIR